jgi:hypothetical protein
MVVTPPTITDWVADSGASNHVTPDAGNLRTFQFRYSSSIVDGNIASIGDTVLRGSFYFNNILVTHYIIEKILFVRHFTIDN